MTGFGGGFNPSTQQLHEIAVLAFRSQRPDGQQDTLGGIFTFDVNPPGIGNQAEFARKPQCAVIVYSPLPQNVSRLSVVGAHFAP